jgi:hypothetical protein
MLACRLIDFFEMSYMRSAAFNSIEQFSPCTLDGRRTACLGAQKYGHAFAVGGNVRLGWSSLSPLFLISISLEAGVPAIYFSLKYLALQYVSHATRPSTLRHGTYQKHSHMF